MVNSVKLQGRKKKTGLRQCKYTWTHLLFLSAISSKKNTHAVLFVWNPFQAPWRKSLEQFSFSYSVALPAVRESLFQEECGKVRADHILLRVFCFQVVSFSKGDKLGLSGPNSVLPNAQLPPPKKAHLLKNKNREKSTCQSCFVRILTDILLLKECPRATGGWTWSGYFSEVVTTGQTVTLYVNCRTRAPTWSM